MAPPEIKCTLKNFGTFSTPTFGGVGEPFNDGRQRACALAHTRRRALAVRAAGPPAVRRDAFERSSPPPRPHGPRLHAFLLWEAPASPEQ